MKFNGVAGPRDGLVLPPPETNHEFLFAGQLADYKGLPLLIDAWRRTTSPANRLRILGDGTGAPDVHAVGRGRPAHHLRGHRGAGRHG